jgi:CxxC-x17-CxxC domain-containing protein
MGLHPEQDVIYFGRTNYRNANRLFGIKRNDRRQHTYIVGKTGTGKSALISNMIIQDIANGEGVCVVDPHGELVEGILAKIPEERIDDVVYFNPADTDYHIGFNVLELPDPKYKHLVASGLMGIFTKIWSNVWSARMEYILNNAVLALLDTPGSTLLGIPRILVDKDFRQRIVANINDPVVKAFWINEYESWQDKFRNEAIAPIQNKVGQFLSTSIVRNVVGQSKSTIDIFDLMNQGKIFLVNVSKGRIGEDNSALLGAMLITKIQLSAMERVRVPEDERVDFYLYVDEFQNFATDSFAGILSEARKYRLNLILAHQYVGQLVTDTSTKVRDAIFGNAGTMVVFRVGAADAEFLEPEFEPEFMIQDIVNLPNYNIYLKLMVDGIASRPFSATTLPPFKVKASSVAIEEIVENSRKRYARPRRVIEDEINSWSGMMTIETPEGTTVLAEATPAEGGKFRATCSNCSKSIMLSFEPTPGRPVYCKTCLAKVKAGEVLTPQRQASLRSRQRYSSDLAGLGIEFSERKEAPMPARSSFQAALAKQDVVEVVRKPEGKPLSLAELQPSDSSPKKKHASPDEIDINELRREIASSLGSSTDGEHE